MTITTEPLAGLTIDELNHLTSSIGTDTITWGLTTGTSDPYYGTSDPYYGAVGGAGTATVFGSGGTGYTYTTNTTNATSPWVTVSNGGTGSSPTMAINPSTSIEIKGKDADIKINGKSMVTWMEKVEERLNILTPNPELEQEWDDLRRLGNRYRALEKKCKEKAQMWAALKKVQPKQL